MNVNHFLLIAIVLICTSCQSGTKEGTYVTDLKKANVLRITDRLQVMIDQGNGHSDSKKFVTDSVNGYIENRTVYDQGGLVDVYFRGDAEGFVPYSVHPLKDHLLLEGVARRNECHIDLDKNYIIDIAESKNGILGNDTLISVSTDTIRDFVIFPNDNIILSKADYQMLQDAKKSDKYEGERYIIYRYIIGI